MIVVSCYALGLIGIYLAFDQLLNTTPKRAVHAVMKNKNFGYAKRYNQLVDKAADLISQYMKISEYRQMDYDRMLAAIGSPYNAQQYITRLLAQCIFYALAGILLMWITPLIFYIGVIFAAYTYYSEMKGVKEKYQRRIEEIELELPKFCSVINSRLQSTSSTLTILQSFQTIAGAAMLQELRITINDMKTGNPEQALRRFEQRVNSPKVSDVIRGLISVQNGDNQQVYFQSKQHQFNNDYMTIKKKNISKRPYKLFLPGMLAFIFFFAIVLYPLMIGVSRYTQGLF